MYKLSRTSHIGGIIIFCSLTIFWLSSAITIDDISFPLFSSPKFPYILSCNAALEMTHINSSNTSSSCSLQREKVTEHIQCVALKASDDPSHCIIIPFELIILSATIQDMINDSTQESFDVITIQLPYLQDTLSLKAIYLECTFKDVFFFFKTCREIIPLRKKLADEIRKSTVRCYKPSSTNQLLDDRYLNNSTALLDEVSNHFIKKNFSVQDYISLIKMAQFLDISIAEKALYKSLDNRKLLQALIDNKEQFIEMGLQESCNDVEHLVELLKNGSRRYRISFLSTHFEPS